MPQSLSWRPRDAGRDRVKQRIIETPITGSQSAIQIRAPIAAYADEWRPLSSRIA
jgi:hypothetical protein